MNQAVTEQVAIITVKESVGGKNHENELEDEKNLTSDEKEEKANTIMRFVTAPTDGSQLLETVIEQEKVLIDKAKRIKIMIDPVVGDSYYDYTYGQHVKTMIYPIKGKIYGRFMENGNIRSH